MEAARANGAALEVIEVPGGQHGFDSVDHTEESRAAVAQAMTWVAGALRERRVSLRVISREVRQSYLTQCSSGCPSVPVRRPWPLERHRAGRTPPAVAAYDSCRHGPPSR